MSWLDLCIICQYFKHEMGLENLDILPIDYDFSKFLYHLLLLCIICMISKSYCEICFHLRLINSNVNLLTLIFSSVLIQYLPSLALNGKFLKHPFSFLQWHQMKICLYYCNVLIFHQINIVMICRLCIVHIN